jgi:hypothetical protein
VKVIHHSAETLRKRQLLSRLWAGAVIVWSVIRTLIVWAALGDYGLNPWVYLGIDLASAAVDAFTTPRMVLRFIDDHYKSAINWGLLSLVAFIVPDIYIFVGTRTLPKKVIVVLVLVIVTMLAIGVFSVVRKVRKGREALTHIETPVASSGHA